MTEPSATDPDAPDTGPGTCASCGAQLAPEQDWCLACGTASPARIGELPGLKTAAKVGALTLALLVLAVGASYAALNHGGKSTQIASLPPAPAPTTPAATTDTTTATTPPPTTTTTTDETPPSPPVDSTPTVPPDDFSTLPTDTTDTSTPDTSTTDTTNTTSSTPRSTPTKTTPTASTKPKSEKIKLAKNAVSSYDPLVRVQTHTDATAANDGDPSTVFTINMIPSTDGVQSGFLVDLGAAKKVTQIHLQTPTPGFTALVYGATGPDVPKAITDPGWKHLRNAIDVGAADGTAKITLGKHGKGVSNYRYLLLWITSPPTTPAGERDVLSGTDTSTTPAAPTNPTTTSTSPVTQPPPTTTPTTTTTPPPPLGATVSIAELTLFS